MRESRSPPPFNEEPQISKDFWGFFVFSSSDFTDESEGNLAYRITHGFPRIFGRWPMARARNGLLFFCHADFADDADFFSLIILVPQISQIYTDFFHWLFKFHRFHGFPQIFFIHYFSHGFTWIFSGSLLSLSFLLFFCHFFISQILDLSVWEDDADFWFHELEKDYADFSNSLFFLFWIHWFLYIINLLIRHFSDPYFFTSFVLFPYFFTSFFL